MKLKFAIPNNQIFKDFYSISNNDVEITLTEEKNCIDLISTNRVNAAVLSPLGYSRGVAISDYRIIPGPVLALKGYTGYSSVYFRDNLTDIINSFADNPDDFISIASKIILSEKYDLSINPEIFTNEIDNQIENSDIIISSRESKMHKPILDISEDWFDTFEIPLILGFWVINAHLEGINFHSIINSITNPNLIKEEEVLEKINDKFLREPRKGIILRWWNEEIEYALEETIKLLFYHQYIKDIAAVKIFGRD